MPIQTQLDAMKAAGEALMRVTQGHQDLTDHYDPKTGKRIPQPQYGNVENAITGAIHDGFLTAETDGVPAGLRQTVKDLRAMAAELHVVAATLECEIPGDETLEDGASAPENPPEGTAEPEKTTACPQCGGQDLKIGASSYAQAYVSFTPDGEHEMTYIRHGDTEWEDGSPAQCLGCDFMGTIGDFQLLSGRVPQPVTLSRVRALGEQLGGFLFGEATEFLDLWRADHPTCPLLTDTVLREQIRAYLSTRRNWEASCDELRHSAAEAEAEPEDDLGYGNTDDA